MSVEDWAKILGEGPLGRYRPEELLCLFDRRRYKIDDHGHLTLDETGRAIFGHLMRLAWGVICKLVREQTKGIDKKTGKPEPDARASDIRGEIHGIVVDRILDQRCWEDRYRRDFLDSVHEERWRYTKDERKHAASHPVLDDAMDVRASLATHHRSQAAEATMKRMQCARISLLKGIPDLRHRWAVRMHLRKKTFETIGETIGRHPETIAKWVYRYVPSLRRSDPSKPRKRSEGPRG